MQFIDYSIFLTFFNICKENGGKFLSEERLLINSYGASLIRICIRHQE